MRWHFSEWGRSCEAIIARTTEEFVITALNLRRTHGRSIRESTRRIGHRGAPTNPIFERGMTEEER